MAHADVAIVLPKASTNRVGTRNLFGITYLHHAFLMSENWWSVGIRLAARARGTDMGETKLRGDPTQYERMWMQITKRERLSNTSEVSVYFQACHKT